MNLFSWRGTGIGTRTECGGLLCPKTCGEELQGPCDSTWSTELSEISLGRVSRTGNGQPTSFGDRLQRLSSILKVDETNLKPEQWRLI